MKWIVLPFFILTQFAQAKEPTDAAIRSCLSGQSISPGVELKQLANNEVSEMDDYKSGYNVTYYFEAAGKEIGYAKKKNINAIIYDGDIFPISKAIILLSTHIKPYDFNPYLADWSEVNDSSGHYLCVSFNFDGLGRSGSFQGERGGYLLSIPLVKRDRKLFFC